jgi:cell filamentation protein
MAEPSRYSTDDESKDVLKNKLGISNESDLHEAENILLKDSYRYFLDELEKNTVTFSSDLLTQIHHHFLGSLYPWAGKFRTVDISKGSILFASSRFIPELLKNFDKQLLKHLPKKDDSKKEISEKLSFIHNELNAIHPFREGNGRTLRLFLDLLAIDTGYEPINYSASSMKSYFDACKAGMAGNNKPMEKFIYKGLTKLK